MNFLNWDFSNDTNNIFLPSIPLLSQAVFKKYKCFITYLFSFPSFLCKNYRHTQFQTQTILSKVLHDVFSIHVFGGYKHWGSCGLLQWAKVILSSHSHIQEDFTTLSTHRLKYSVVVLTATLETPIVLISKFSQLLYSLQKSTKSVGLHSTFESTLVYTLLFPFFS